MICNCWRHWPKVMPVSRRTIRARDRSLIATRLAHSAMLARSPGRGSVRRRCGAGRGCPAAAGRAVRSAPVPGVPAAPRRDVRAGRRADSPAVARSGAGSVRGPAATGPGCSSRSAGVPPRLDEEEADLAVGGDPVAMGDAAGNPHTEPGRHHPRAIGHRAGDAAAAGHHQLALAMPVHRHFGVVVPGLQLQGPGPAGRARRDRSVGRGRSAVHGSRQVLWLSEFDYFLAE